MPRELEEKIRASVKAAHPEYSEERVNQEVYATMNKLKKRRIGSRRQRGTKHAS